MFCLRGFLIFVLLFSQTNICYSRKIQNVEINGLSNKLPEIETFGVGPRCPPDDAISPNCTCQTGTFILTCDGDGFKDMDHLYVNEIIIKNNKNQDKIPFNFINPNYGCQKIYLENNKMLNDIQSFISGKIESLILINNEALDEKIVLKNLVPKSNINEIHIKNNKQQYTDVDFNIFNGFSNIESLIISVNNISKLSSFSNLEHLKYVDLSQTQINDFEGKPFSKLKNLTQLSLKNTGLNEDDLDIIGLGELKIDGLTINLEDNQITSIKSDTFKNLTKNKVKVYLNGNKINCPFDEINWIFESQYNARDYLLDVFCEDMNKQNIFEIKHFTDETYPPIPTLPTINGTVTVSILKGSFNVPSVSYIGVCFNEKNAPYTTDPTIPDCELCAQDNNSTIKEHTYKNLEPNGVCKRKIHEYSDDLNLVFGISAQKQGALVIENVIGVAFLNINEDVISKGRSGKQFPLYFAGTDGSTNQFIEIQVDWAPK